jgi:outer membrane protein assembly factor BamB
VAGEFGGVPGVVAFDAETGATDWIRQLGVGSGGGTRVTAGPSGDRVYLAGVVPEPGDDSRFPAQDILVRARDASDGSILWRTRLDARDADLQAVLHDGARDRVLVVGSGGGDPYFSSIDPVDGAPEWSTFTATPQEASLLEGALAQEAGLVLAAGVQGAIGPFVSGDTDRLLAAVRAGSGEVAWTRAPDDARDSGYVGVAPDPDRARLYGVGSDLAANGTSRTIVDAVAVGDGSPTWTRALGTEVPGNESASSVQVSDQGRIFVGSDARRSASIHGDLLVRALDPGGALEWTHASADRVLAYDEPRELQVGPHGRCVYVAARSLRPPFLFSNYEVRVVGTDAGELRDRVQVPGPTTDVKDVFELGTNPEDGLVHLAGTVYGRDPRAQAPLVPGGDADGEEWDWLVTALEDPCA